MAVEEVVLRYNPDTGHLVGFLPGRNQRVKDTTPIFVFGPEEGIAPTSFVLFVGYDPDTDEVTGEIISFEMLDFRKNFLHIRQQLFGRIERLTPPRTIQPNGHVFYELMGVDLSGIDPDIKSDLTNIQFMLSLPKNLVEMYFEAAVHHIQNPDGRMPLERALSLSV